MCADLPLLEGALPGDALEHGLPQAPLVRELFGPRHGGRLAGPRPIHPVPRLKGKAGHGGNRSALLGQRPLGGDAGAEPERGDEQDRPDPV